MNPFEAFRFGGAASAAPPSPLKRPRSPVAPPAALPRRDWAQPPAAWEEVYRRVSLARAGRTASVDAFHSFLLDCRAEPSPAFQVLVAALLSVQCRDSVALAATLRLRAALGGAITPAAVRDAPPGCVEDAVATCNLRNAKVSQRVHRRFHRLYLAF
jgi:endonuclease III